jgi:hypothetical protein
MTPFNFVQDLFRMVHMHIVHRTGLNAEQSTSCTPWIEISLAMSWAPQEHQKIDSLSKVVLGIEKMAQYI